MALPQLTDEQRKEALAKAAEARKQRAELKASLKRGDTTLKDVLGKAESDEIIGKTKVSALLEAMPKVGKVKAREIMEELEIAQTRRLRGLGERQRRALLERFERGPEDPVPFIYGDPLGGGRQLAAGPEDLPDPLSQVLLDPLEPPGGEAGVGDDQKAHVRQ